MFKLKVSGASLLNLTHSHSAGSVFGCCSWWGTLLSCACLARAQQAVLLTAAVLHPQASACHSWLTATAVCVLSTGIACLR